jgi:hypothetical protein
MSRVSCSSFFFSHSIRIILGKYERPYGEFPWKQDFQILVNACKMNKRPTIKEGVFYVQYHSLSFIEYYS